MAKNVPAAEASPDLTPAEIRQAEDAIARFVNDTRSVVALGPLLETIKKGMAQMADLQRKMDGLQADLDTLKREVERLEGQKAALEAEVRKLEGARDAVRGALAGVKV